MTVPAASVVRDADAERFVAPDGSSLRLLADPAVTGCDLSVHHSVLGNGAVGAGPHHHHTSAELFYVIGGTLDLLLGDEVVRAAAGDFVAVPAGTVHAFGATAGSDAEVLVLTPTVERFDMFRQAFGAIDPDTGDDPDRFDTYADTSPTWARTRRTTP